MRTFIIVIVLGLVVVFFVGFVPKILNQHELKRMEETTAGAVKTVRTVTAAQAPMAETGFLPGNISAIQYATIYARVDGYLKSRLADIGDQVKTGELLAEIDAPTIDQEVVQADADLSQAHASVSSAQASLLEQQAKDKEAQAQVDKAKADQDYTQITATRWQRMADKGAVSIQSRDEKERSNLAQTAQLDSTRAQKLAADEAVVAARAAVTQALALEKAKVASLNRYRAQQAFKYVRAPFDGFITVRKVDPGALITAGSQSQNLELFQLAKIDALRIYINVPQAFSRYLKPGQKAQVNVAEFPERNFDGYITNVSSGLDPQTRTLQTEIHISNADHTLLPGMYAQVKLLINRLDPWVSIDSNAVVPRDNTTEVAVVTDNKAHYEKVVLGRDFGDTVEIKAGLKKGDVVIVSPPVDLQDGETVKPESMDTAKSDSHK